jgi:predicted dehydrogenase
MLPFLPASRLRLGPNRFSRPLLPGCSRRARSAWTTIDAGKVVYCEWPLARNLGEARELAPAARAKGLRTVVGLQGRTGPAVRCVRDLVADGYLEKPLGTVIKAGAPHAVCAGVLDEPYEFHADPANGARSG